MEGNKEEEEMEKRKGMKRRKEKMKGNKEEEMKRR